MADIGLDPVLDPVAEEILGYLVVDEVDGYVKFATSFGDYKPPPGQKLVPVAFRADLEKTAAIPGWYLAPDGKSLIAATQEQVNDKGENAELEDAKQRTRTLDALAALQAVADDPLNSDSLRAWAVAQLAFMRG